MPHISLAAETLFTVFGFPVTNSLLTTYIVIAFLIVLGVSLSSNLEKRPGRMQMMWELIIGGLFSFFTNLGGKHGKLFAPLGVTLFLFIVVSNWAGLLPGVGTIGLRNSDSAEHAIVRHAQAATSTEDSSHLETVQTEQIDSEEGHTVVAEDVHHSTFIPIFRGPTADLSTTLALALIAVGAIQYYGFSLSGLSYGKKFIDLRSPIYFFVGLLELISDISKVLSFAFRLFGNVFAGEVLLTVMAFLPIALLNLPPFLLPIPFYGLEIFVGFVQGLVFAMLLTVFLNVAVSHGEHSEHAHQGEAH